MYLPCISHIASLAGSPLRRALAAETRSFVDISELSDAEAGDGLAAGSGERRSLVVSTSHMDARALAAILAAKEHEETAEVVTQAASFRRRSSLGGGLGGGRSRSATWSSGLDSSINHSDSGTPLPQGGGHMHAALTPAREEDELEPGHSPASSPQGRLARGSRRASM